MKSTSLIFTGLMLGSSMAHAAMVDMRGLPKCKETTAITLPQELIGTYYSRESGDFITLTRDGVRELDVMAREHPTTGKIILTPEQNLKHQVDNGMCITETLSYDTYSQAVYELKLIQHNVSPFGVSHSSESYSVKYNTRDGAQAKSSNGGWGLALWVLPMAAGSIGGGWTKPGKIHKFPVRLKAKKKR